MSACSGVRNVRFSSKARKVTKATLQTGTLPGIPQKQSQVFLKITPRYSSKNTPRYSSKKTFPGIPQKLSQVFFPMHFLPKKVFEYQAQFNKLTQGVGLGRAIEVQKGD